MAAAGCSVSCLLSFDGLTGGEAGSSGSAGAGGNGGASGNAGAGNAGGSTGATAGTGAGGSAGNASGGNSSAGSGGDAGSAGSATGGSSGACSTPTCKCCGDGGAAVCTDPVETLLGTSVGKARGRVAALGEVVYWTRQPDALMRRLPGGKPEELVSANYPEAVVAENNWLAWSDSAGLYRCRADNCQSTATRFISALDVNERQVLALQNGMLYWLVGTGDLGRRLVHCDLASCSSGNEQTVSNGRDSVRGIAANSTHVFWTEEGGAIFRLPLGTSNDAPAPFLDSRDHPSSIVVSETQLFWTEEGDPGSLYYCDIASCTPTPIAPNTTLQHPIRAPAGLASDGQRIYWTNLLSDSVMSCPLPGCSSAETPELVATGQITPNGVAVGSTCAIWHAVENGDGAVWVKPKRP
ncbi:MAG: hypothetical protein H6718_05020 [Polyangiaceae bacterium]|nr:hypothetical protein [Myxococcales bacterium]MCB9584733.1 hypothetical protein [Polyangiaceae bacterium]MCB9607694.1 hypothetical protein [Polyangiaceae bacterium]